jgi:purine-binding chemotaxis protein CheW
MVEQSQYLTFTLAGDEFGIDLLRVKEIIEYVPPTVVPRTPVSVRGIINVRGSVVPVVDLAVGMGLPSGEITKRTCIVILEVDLDGADTVMGIVADAVNEVTYMAAKDIEESPEFGTRISLDFLHGIGKLGEQFVLLLDVDRVLSVQEFEALANVHAEADDSAPAEAIDANGGSEDAQSEVGDVDDAVADKE